MFHSSWKLCSFILFITLFSNFQCGKYLLTSLRSQILSLLCSVHCLRSYWVILISSISLLFFIIVSIPLLTLTFRYYMLPTFSSSALNILIIIILNFCPKSFPYLNHVLKHALPFEPFFFPFSRLCNFLLKSKKLCIQLKELM